MLKQFHYQSYRCKSYRSLIFRYQLVNDEANDTIAATDVNAGLPLVD